MGKKIVSFLLTVVVLFSCLLANVRTVDAQMADSADSLTINEYVESVVQGYSYANNLMVDSISNAIPVIDAETLEVDHYLFFAFVENAVKGFVNVYGEDSFTSNFIKTDVNIVEGDKINIFCKDNEVFFVNDEEFYHLGGEYNDLTGYSYPDCGQIEVECYEVENNNQNLTRANYHNGTSYTAQDVYDACDDSDDDNKPSGNATGHIDWMLFGFSLYGISAIHVNGGKILGQIENLLANDTPIMCLVERSVIENGRTVIYGHTTLLIGIYVYGSSNIYMFRDSNESDGIISINVPEEALTDATKVVYSDSHNVYLDWAGCIY